MNGEFEFRNLPPGMYQPVAFRDGFEFGTPPPINLTADVTGVEIAAPTGACTYSAADPAEMGSAGGDGQFSVITTPNSANCGWQARRDDPNDTWLTVRSGVGAGNGTVEFTLEANTGVARMGRITISGRPEPVIIRQAAGVPASGFEGDLAPRPSGGDGLTATDSAQFKRFLSGADTFSMTENEYQRTDVAPEETLGDGRLDATDQQQINNYAAALDPQRPAGGPTTPVPLARSAKSEEGASEAAKRIYRVVPAGDGNGYVTAAIEMDARGNETALTLTLNFDPRHLSIADVSGTDRNPEIARGSEVPTGTSITVNATQVAAGRIGILLDAAEPFAPGTRRIVFFRFRVLKDAEPGPTLLTFGDDTLVLSTSDASAKSLEAVYEGGNVIIPELRDQSFFSGGCSQEARRNRTVFSVIFRTLLEVEFFE